MKLRKITIIPLGEFRIQLKIRPKPGYTHLSEKITVLDEDSLTLKAVGVLKLEQSESVEIIIYRYQVS